MQDRNGCCCLQAKVVGLNVCIQARPACFEKPTTGHRPWHGRRGDPMLRVLGRATSGNVQKVVWRLEELGTPYKREDYGRQFNNTQDAAYLGLNPNGKVPTLVDGDTVVWESNTILRYICNKQGRNDIYPTDAGRS